MTKDYVCHPPYLTKHTSLDHFLLHKFKMMSYPVAFFIFSKFWFSGLLWGAGGKEQKMAQNDKKQFVSLCISGNVPHMIVVFGTHV